MTMTAAVSSSAPARPVYLLLGDDPFRIRLRLAELVAALASGSPTNTAGVVRWPSPDLGAPLGVTRHDARSDAPDAIVMSGASQGLFAALDERRVVIVEHAEALRGDRLVTEFPPDAALILVTTETLPASRAKRGGARAKKEQTTGVDLRAAVSDAGGRVERILRLPASEVPGWITGRAQLRALELAPAAVDALAIAVGADSDRIEQELAKLGAFAGGRTVEAADVRALVAGAIESDVFALTEAVVRQDTKGAVARLEELLADGQAAQQILALLVWQFRVLLFASAMRGTYDANRMAKAIRASSPASLFRWQAQARRVDRKRITRAYESLYATDLAIKQGRTDPETALTLCVLDLCGIANADVRELTLGEPPRR
ncbi:MAG: DNA polymerase III subunit delta [Chloroflexota bacterium]|nr:DNA polymerase III subunit delta [Chloroflexota bacterium]